MAKRGSNIYKRKDGCFEGRVPVGYNDNGKIKYKSVYARTLAEVKEKMSEMYSVRQNLAVSPIKLTVADAAEQWLSSACFVLRSQAMQTMRILFQSIFSRFSAASTWLI